MSSHHDIRCICEPTGHREAEELRFEVASRLGVAPGDLATASLFSLAWQLGVEVYVYADQWFGVSVVSADKSESEFVPCDLPLDGVLYLWKVLADRHPEKVAPGPGCDLAPARAASEAQLRETGTS